MSAVFDARISLDRTGEGAGVERQEAECRQLADRLGLAIDRVYTDTDISATSGATRPEFERMLAARPSAIITWAQDRLLRLSGDLEKVIKLNVPVHMVTQGTLDLATPAGRAVARTVAAWSTFETEQKGLRQLAANDQRASKGLPTVRPGYGYRREDGRDVVVEDEAEIIREVAGRVLDGESMRSVAADLNRRGVDSPRTAEMRRKVMREQPKSATIQRIPWQGVTLKQMLRRPSLAGLRTHRGNVVGEFDAAAHPAILDRDTHDRLVALFDDPTRASSSRVGHPPKHLLSGIAVCGLCGDTLGGRMKRLPGWNPKPGQKSKPVKPAYACGTCHKVRRLQKPVDELVTEVLLRRLEREDAADLFTPGDPESVADLRSSIAAVTARLASAADMFSAGTIDADQLTRITAAGRTDREQLEQRLKEALPQALPADAIGPGAREAWARYDIERKRLILSTLMRVTVLPAGSGASFDPELIRIDWLSEDR